MKLNIGSGTIDLEGWMSVDHRADAKPDLVDDGFELNTVEPGTVDEIFASHIIEHACFDRTITILKRWHEVLVPGGILWIAVPDFRLVMGRHIEQYTAGKITWDYFNSRIFGNAKVAHQMYGDGMVEEVPGVHKYELAFHRAVFTPKMMAQCLAEAGFLAKGLDRLPGKFKHPDEMCMKGTKQ